MDLLTGDFRQPARKAPPPPGRLNSSTPTGPRIYMWNDDLLIIDEDECVTSKSGKGKQALQSSGQNGLPRSHSLPISQVGQKKKPPPPRPPPPKTGSQLYQDRGSVIFRRLHMLSIKKLPVDTGMQKTQLSQDGKQKNVSPGGVGGVLNKFRGPPPSRPKMSTVHRPTTTTSAPCTPISEACLIDFSSPPGSPTTRSGSDGLSVNSLGSESSAGNQSTGFDDNFDPFGSIQEAPRKIGASAFYGSTNAATAGSVFGNSYGQNPVSSLQGSEKLFGSDPFDNAFFKQQDNDPFEMLAARAQNELPQVAPPKTTINPANAVPSVHQPDTSEDNVKTKISFKPTIIRPKTAVKSENKSSPSNSSINLSSLGEELGTIDWSKNVGRSTISANGGDGISWSSSASPSLIDQTIPEEPPPLPPRPLEQEDDQDLPYAIAEYDFACTQASDLPFEAGEKIQLLYRISADWLFGRCGMKEGMFPESFVNIIVPLPSEDKGSSGLGSSSPSVATKSSSSLASNFGALPAINSSISGESTTTKGSESSPSWFTKTTEPEDPNVVNVLYSFNGEYPEDLTIYEGTQVKVHRVVDKDWLYGEYNGNLGQFPTNFVDRVPSGLSKV